MYNKVHVPFLKKKKKRNVPKISPKKREKEYESIWYVFKQQFLIFFFKYIYLKKCKNTYNIV